MAADDARTRRETPTMPSPRAVFEALGALDRRLRSPSDPAGIPRALRHFASSAPPGMSLAAYGERLCHYLAGGDTAELALALALAGRVERHTKAGLCALTAHRVLGAAYLVALKLTHDRLPCAAPWLAGVVGVQVPEVAWLERHLLRALAFDLHVRADDAAAAVALLRAPPPLPLVAARRGTGASTDDGGAAVSDADEDCAGGGHAAASPSLAPADAQQRSAALTDDADFAAAVRATPSSFGAAPFAYPPAAAHSQQ